MFSIDGWQALCPVLEVLQRPAVALEAEAGEQQVVEQPALFHAEADEK